LVKTVFVNVPQSEAEEFKGEKEKNAYYFFLGDLRVILSHGRTYKVQETYPWHFKVFCSDFNPTFISEDLVEKKFFIFQASVKPATLNGLTNPESFLEKKVNEDVLVHEIFQRPFKGGKQPFLPDHFIGKATITYSTKKSREKGLDDIYAEIAIKFSKPNYLSEDMDEIIMRLEGRIHALISEYPVELKEVSCEPVDSSFEINLEYKVNK